ncbi:MAG: four-helix bundle copper-binding protein [Gallionella sp.]|nr:four-helix bundle copper-binding protein [Gallionella sp.]
MNRRELLLGSLAMAGAAVVGSARAAEHKHDMSEHHHDASSANLAVAAAASDCLQKGEVCLNHCLDLWATGEKDMASCAKSVNQVLALCGSLQQLANQNSKHLAKLAKVAMVACKECEDECKKFDKHAACKACGESCAACYKECQKIAA